MANLSITSASVVVGVSASQQNLLNDGRTINEQVGGASLISQTLTNGSEIDKIDRAYQLATVTLPGGTSLVVDLFDLGSQDIGAGAGNIGLGQPAHFVEIVTFLLKHVSGAGELTVAPDATNGWTQVDTRTGAKSIGAKGCYLMHQPDEDGMPVTDGASHRVIIGAVTSPVVFSLYLLGRQDTEVSSSSSSTSSASSSSTSSSSTSSSSLSSSSSSSISSSSSSSLSSSSTSSSLSSSSSTSTSSLSSSSSSSLSSSSSSST